LWLVICPAELPVIIFLAKPDLCLWKTNWTNRLDNFVLAHFTKVRQQATEACIELNPLREELYCHFF
jgi:hypothetical protein